MSDLISRQTVINALDALCDRECVYNKRERGLMCNSCHLGSAFDVIDELPPAEPEQKTGQLSNKEWIDFLVAQFDISRTSARDMLHVMMQVKREDNFKKQFSQRNDCLVKDLVKENGGGA